MCFFFSVYCSNLLRLKIEYLLRMKMSLFLPWNVLANDIAVGFFFKIFLHFEF